MVSMGRREVDKESMDQDLLNISFNNRTESLKLSLNSVQFWCFSEELYAASFALLCWWETLIFAIETGETH